MTQTTVTYTLEEVLKRIENKIDKLTEKVTTLEIAVAALSEKFDGMDRRVLKLKLSQVLRSKICESSQ